MRTEMDRYGMDDNKSLTVRSGITVLSCSTTVTPLVVATDMVVGRYWGKKKVGRFFVEHFKFLGNRNMPGQSIPF